MVMESRQNSVLVNAILMFVLTWVTVSLRVYVRGFLKKAWGKDDSFMVAALGVYTVYLSFHMVSITTGIGRHRADISDKDNRISLMFWYLGELLYVITTAFLKFSIGYFYLRIAVIPWQIWVIRMLMGGTIVFSVVYFFLVLAQCRPISEFWNNHPASDKCIAPGPTLGITYALAGVNAAADWCLGLLPLFIVKGTNMDFKTKALVVAILSFAAIGGTGTIVRMFYLHTLLDGPDFLWATTDVAIWSTVEPGIGITAGSIATLRPLIQVCLYRIGLTANSGREGEHSGSTLTNMILLPGARLRLDSIAELGIIRPDPALKKEAGTYSGSTLKERTALKIGQRKIWAVILTSKDIVFKVSVWLRNFVTSEWRFSAEQK